MQSIQSASSARARWATGLRRCSRRRASTCGSSTSRSRCSIARETQIEKSLGEVRREGKTRRRRSRRARSRACGLTTALDDLADADYIVEAIVENADAKRALFARLDALDRPRHDPRVEHVVDFDHAARRRDEAARTRCSACTS